MVNRGSGVWSERLHPTKAFLQKSSRSPGGRFTLAKVKRAAQLRIDERTEDRDKILSLKGSADILSMPAVQEILSRCSRQEVRLLLIDLSETEFINSPVWAVITLYARKQREKSRVAIIGMSDRIRGSFEMMGLQKELETFADVETARKAMLD
jgi:anti-anti-sigma factor